MNRTPPTENTMVNNRRPIRTASELTRSKTSTTAVSALSDSSEIIFKGGQCVFVLLKSTDPNQCDIMFQIVDSFEENEELWVGLREMTLTHKPFVPDTARQPQIDITIKMEEFTKQFSSGLIFHPLSSFKSSKASYSVSDENRPTQPPLLLCKLLIINPEDAGDTSKETRVLISLHSYGKMKAQGHHAPITLILEEYDWKESRFIQQPCLILSSNNVKCSAFNLKAGRHAYRFMVDGTSPWAAFFSSSTDDILLEDEAVFLQGIPKTFVKDFDESFSTSPPWIIPHKYKLNVTTSALISPQIYVPEAYQSTVSLRLMNDAKQEDIPTCVGLISPQIFQPNGEGYSIYVECRSTVKQPVKFKMRFIYEIQDKETAAASDVTFSQVNMTIKDIEEPLAPNPKGLLFRYNVDMKDLSVAAPSFQLSCGNSNIRFVLQLLDHETEIKRVKGRGTATMYYCRLGNKLPEEHKYVLQGSVNPFDLPKLQPKPQSANELPRSPSKEQIRSSAMDRKGPSPAVTSPKKKKTGSASEDHKPVSTDANWKIRMTVEEDASALNLSKNTEKEDRYSAIKASWEQAQPGRALKAREIRDAYMKQVELGNVPPMSIDISGFSHLKPWTVFDERGFPQQSTLKTSYLEKFVAPQNDADPEQFVLDAILPGNAKQLNWDEDDEEDDVSDNLEPRVLMTDVDREQSHERLREHLCQFEQLFGEHEAYRSLARQNAEKKLNYLLSKMDSINQQYEEWKRLDKEKRDDHRKVIMKKLDEIQQLKAAEEAAKIAADPKAAEAQKKQAKGKK